MKILLPLATMATRPDSLSDRSDIKSLFWLLFACCCCCFVKGAIHEIDH